MAGTGVDLLWRFPHRNGPSASSSLNPTPATRMARPKAPCSAAEQFQKTRVVGGGIRVRHTSEPPRGKRHPFFGRKPLPHGFSKRSTQTAPARRGTPCRSASRRPGRAPPAAAAGSGPRGGPRAGVAVGARPRQALRPRALGRNSTTAAAALGGGRLLSNAFLHPFLLISVHVGLLIQ